MYFGRSSTDFLKNNLTKLVEDYEQKWKTMRRKKSKYLGNSSDTIVREGAMEVVVAAAEQPSSDSINEEMPELVVHDSKPSCN